MTSMSMILRKRKKWNMLRNSLDMDMLLSQVRIQKFRTETQQTETQLFQLSAFQIIKKLCLTETRNSIVNMYLTFKTHLYKYSLDLFYPLPAMHSFFYVLVLLVEYIFFDHLLWLIFQSSITHQLVNIYFIVKINLHFRNRNCCLNSYQVDTWYNFGLQLQFLQILTCSS